MLIAYGEPRKNIPWCSTIVNIDPILSKPLAILKQLLDPLVGSKCWLSTNKGPERIPRIVVSLFNWLIKSTIIGYYSIILVHALFPLLLNHSPLSNSHYHTNLFWINKHILTANLNIINCWQFVLIKPLSISNSFTGCQRAATDQHSTSPLISLSPGVGAFRWSAVALEVCGLPFFMQMITSKMEKTRPKKERQRLPDQLFSITNLRRDFGYRDWWLSQSLNPHHLIHHHAQEACHPTGYQFLNCYEKISGAGLSVLHSREQPNGFEHICLH